MVNSLVGVPMVVVVCMLLDNLIQDNARCIDDVTNSVFSVSNLTASKAMIISVISAGHLGVVKLLVVSRYFGDVFRVMDLVLSVVLIVIGVHDDFTANCSVFHAVVNCVNTNGKRYFLV